MCRTLLREVLHCFIYYLAFTIAYEERIKKSRVNENASAILYPNTKKLFSWDELEPPNWKSGLEFDYPSDLYKDWDSNGEHPEGKSRSSKSLVQNVLIDKIYGYNDSSIGSLKEKHDPDKNVRSRNFEFSNTSDKQTELKKIDYETPEPDSNYNKFGFQRFSPLDSRYKINFNSKPFQESSELLKNKNNLNSHSERRNHNSNIRHQKSRKIFVRTRKSPGTKISQISQKSFIQKINPDTEIKQYFENSEGNYLSSGNNNGESNLELRSEKEIKKYISNKNYSVSKDKYERAYNKKGGEDISEDSKEGLQTAEKIKEITQKPKEIKMDVVTKFLRIVESQHLLGENCTKGTDFHLGEGVVDRYAQERFRLEAELAVNRANLYTRLWKYSRDQVLMSEYLLHAEVLSIVEFDEDIFAAGNCYDKYEYKGYVLFCPFAYRLPNGLILVKDLAVEYKYLTESSEWFYISRAIAERIIQNYDNIIKAGRPQLVISLGT